MTTIIILDSTPVGLISNPKATESAKGCQQWFKTLFEQGYKVILSEIVDYEIRRELLRANKISGIRKLDKLKSELIYLPITTEVMLKAAELWAETRKKGRPTADNKALDGDMILTAQALLLKNLDYKVTIVTSNIKHFAMFVDAKEWEEIQLIS